MDVTQFQAALLDMDGVITKTAQVHARAGKQMVDQYLQRREERMISQFEGCEELKESAWHGWGAAKIGFGGQVYTFSESEQREFQLHS